MQERNATIAIQSSRLTIDEVEGDMEACAALAIEPIHFQLVPFSDQIEGDLAYNGPVVPFGGTKLFGLWAAGKLPANWQLFYDERSFELDHWLPTIGRFAVNHDCEFARYQDVQQRAWTSAKFIKPANDRKAFAGIILEAGETLAEALRKVTTDDSLTGSQLLCIADLKQMGPEYRCWMVDGELVEASLYKVDGRHKIARPDLATVNALRSFCVQLEGTFRPHGAYVVDVVERVDRQFQVVEYNCLNCAGRYAADRAAIFQAVLRFAKNKFVDKLVREPSVD
jgi:ATP-grasp domain, R2K clade family 3